MKKIKYQKNKFVVINRKYLEESNRTIPESIKRIFLSYLDTVNNFIPNNNYYVCTADEPYAKKVLKTILKGEQKKEEKRIRALHYILRLIKAKRRVK